MAYIPKRGNEELVITKPNCFSQPMFVKEKRLLGAGPSNPRDNVLKALSRPMMGHLHPETLKVSNVLSNNFQFWKTVIIYCLFICVCKNVCLRTAISIATHTCVSFVS